MDNAATPRKGHLLLADISGYTAFLTQSELDHAQDILRVLFEKLLAEIRDPWAVCEIEGDAIFAYAPESSMVQGQTLLEVVESLYSAFAGLRDQMQRNTTCTCTACRLIHSLDLKFVAHFGTFIIQELSGQTSKPSGPDVIVLHRLLKNTIQEKTGISAYAYLTEASVKALGLQDLAAHFVRHSELYSHLGRIEGYVYDLHPFWAREKERYRELVRKDQSWISFELDVPAPPQVVWEYLHEPERKRKWREADELKVLGLSAGRTDVGTTHHCYHGKMVILEEIVDWRPFSYFTCEVSWPMNAKTRFTSYLEPVDAGTHLSSYILRPRAGNAIARPFVAVVYAFLRRGLQQDYEKSMLRMRDLIIKEGADEFQTALAV